MQDLQIEVTKRVVALCLMGLVMVGEMTTYYTQSRWSVSNCPCCRLDLDLYFYISHLQLATCSSTMVPLLSRSWSCSTLMASCDQARQHYQRQAVESLSEEEMKKQLEVPRLQTSNGAC